LPRRLPPCYVVTPRLSWEQIRHRAGEFAKEWQTETHEKGQAQSFYKDFFTIFGIKRRQVASFERRVQSDDRLKGGFIDLFWPGTLIAEHKSAGLNLSNATGQALDYFDWLPDNQEPRYILTCDFQNWRLLDLDENREIRFRLHELPKHVEAFAFILGRRRSYGKEAAVTIAAAELMGKLHDRLEASGYSGHDLERLLVRYEALVNTLATAPARNRRTARRTQVRRSPGPTPPGASAPCPARPS
jgi:hypothetical protein